MTSRHRAGHLLRICTALTAWSALLLQLYLMLRDVPDILQGLASYFSFFTVLTNLLVALASTMPLMTPASTIGRFFCRADVATMTAASITLVGIAYLLLLSHLWSPQGWMLVADVALHYLTPALFVAYWWLAVGKQSLRWSDMAAWTLYPIGYFAYAMLRGALTGRYPYYFIDAAHLGYGMVLINAAGVLLGFLAVSATMIGIGHLQTRRAAA